MDWGIYREDGEYESTTHTWIWRWDVHRCSTILRYPELQRCQHRKLHLTGTTDIGALSFFFHVKSLKTAFASDIIFHPES